MQIYIILNVIAAMMLLTYNLLQYKEKKKILGGVSRRAIAYFTSKQVCFLSTIGCWVVFETVMISIAQYFLPLCFNMILGEVLNTGANYFGNLFSAPVLVLLACVLLKIDFLAQMDLFTPAFPLALFFSKIGCFFAGCCRGMVWEHGFYNPVSKLTEFPAQLLEAAVALLLFIFLLLCKGKLKKGTVFPVYLMAFSGIRFFTEFTRCEPRTFHGLKTYQVLCLIGVVVGLVEYFLARAYSTRVQKKEQIPEKY